MLKLGSYCSWRQWHCSRWSPHNLARRRPRFSSFLRSAQQDWCDSQSFCRLQSTLFRRVSCLPLRWAVSVSLTILGSVLNLFSGYLKPICGAAVQDLRVQRSKGLVRRNNRDLRRHRARQSQVRAMRPVPCCCCKGLIGATKFTGRSMSSPRWQLCSRTPTSPTPWASHRLKAM